MNAFLAALWAEALKAWRSKVTVLTALGFLLLPAVGGMFMLILKNPERAQELGLIGVKARLSGATADWPAYLGVITLGTAAAGSVLFAFITSWVFGREFSDHTVKELLALPTPRAAIVAAKLVLLAVWFHVLAIIVFVVGLGVGRAVDIPGWTMELQTTSFRALLVITLLTYMLMPVVALFASAGRGYLPPMGWAFLTLMLGQIATVLGRGDWLPWAVPMQFSSASGAASSQIGLHSYLVVLGTFLAGLAATFIWWQSADQAR